MCGKRKSENCGKAKNRLLDVLVVITTPKMAQHFTFTVSLSALRLIQEVFEFTALGAGDSASP